ncbi:MAG: hypothetical protein R3E31_23395 [Chloroflexota bacterium]
MMKITFWVRVGLLSLVVWLAACSGGEVRFSTANIAAAQLAQDADGTQTTTTFAARYIYLIVDLRNAPDGTKVKASWTAID